MMAVSYTHLVQQADMGLVGFWTDKGTCDESTAQFLQQLENKQVFLFGTAGFGGSAEFFQQILNRVMQNLAPSNVVLGTWMCPVSYTHLDVYKRQRVPCHTILPL